VLKVDDPRTEAEVTVKAIRSKGRFAVKKPSLWRKGYQIEKRMLGNDDVSDRIYSRRIPRTRAEYMVGGKLANLIKVFFSVGARIRLAPSKHAGNPDNGWIGRKDRFSVSKTAEAVI
jgi:hypothetical protein